MDTYSINSGQLPWSFRLGSGLRDLRFDDSTESQFRHAFSAERAGKWQLWLGLAVLSAAIWLGLRTQAPLVLAVCFTGTALIYFVAALRFEQALLCSAVVFIGYVIAETVSPADAIGVVNGSLFLLLPNLVGGLSAWHTESKMRQRFLQEQELKYQANHDALTGLWNRRALQEHAQRAWAHCNREHQALSFALIDIDHFKHYNDLYGHTKGDQCLAEVGRLLRGIGQRPLDLVARYGGEEFAVLLPNCSAGQACRILQQFRRQLAGMSKSGSPVVERVTVSAGVVTLLPKQNTLDFNSLVNAADSALYSAKHKGRDCIVMDDASDEPLPSNVKPFSRPRHR